MKTYLAIAMVIAILSSTNTSAQLSLSNGATVASIVIDRNTGTIVEEHDADRLMTPASLTKLLTTAAAIEYLGPQTQFETNAYYNANDACLTIQGLCDPTMGSSYFTWHSPETFADIIADQLISRNAKNISALHLDDSFIVGPTLSSKRLWEDMGNYFGASPEAFNVFDNTAIVSFKSPSKLNATCEIASITTGTKSTINIGINTANSNTTTAPTLNINIDNYVHTYAKKADSVYIYGNADHWYASGAIPTNQNNFRVKAALPRPAQVFAEAVRRQLNARGINIASIKISSTPTKRGTLIAQAKSPSIASIIKTTNHESVNLYADALMLHLGESVTNKNNTLNKGEIHTSIDKGEKHTTSIDEGLATLRSFVETTTESKPYLYDGSGLSPMNALSPRQIALIIQHAVNSPHGIHYENSLATAGIDGTLRRLGKGTKIEGKIKGKSGSMSGVLGYAGIIKTAGSRDLIFCIIVNHYEEPSAELRKRIASWLSTFVK